MIYASVPIAELIEVFRRAAIAPSGKAKEIAMEVLLIWVVLGFFVAAVAAAIRHLRQVHQERVAAIAAAEYRRKKWVRDIEQARFPTRALLHSEKSARSR